MNELIHSVYLFLVLYFSVNALLLLAIGIQALALWAISAAQGTVARMASKRKIRRKMCEKKRRYQNADEAIIAVKAIRKRESKSLDAYWCKWCNGYHIGKRPSKNPSPLWRPKRHEEG